MTLFEAPATATGGQPTDSHSAAQHALAAELDRELAATTTLEERLLAIRASVDGSIAFSTSLGIEDQAITLAIATTASGIDIFTLDTGRHFPETLDTLFDTEGKYGIKIRVMFPYSAAVEELVENDGVYGFRYSVEARKACCEIRKVEPLNRALKGAAGWVTGLRREQSQGRSHVPFASYDPVQKLIKLNPIADWSLEKLEDLRCGETKFPSMLCTRRAFLRSVASRALAPSSRVKTSVPAAGGGKTRTARNAGFTRSLKTLDLNQRTARHDGGV